MKIGPKLIECLKRAAEIERELISTLTESEREAAGTPEQWEVKDQFAHCAAWSERLAKNISSALEGKTPMREEDYEHVNSEIFEENRNRPWAEISDYSRFIHQDLIDVIQSIPEIHLSEGELLPWQSGRELWKLIIGTSYTHPLTHYCHIYLERDEAKLASEIQEEMAKRLSELDDSPSWMGVNKYNLACFYSLSGQKERAISGLRDALRLNPELEDWSKQDPDFDPIREDAEYLAIYSD